MWRPASLSRSLRIQSLYLTSCLHCAKVSCQCIYNKLYILWKCRTKDITLVCLVGGYSLQLFVYLESWRLVNPFGASRMTRCLHNTRSSASFHIPHNLSLSIPLHRPIAVLLAFLVISPLNLPYKIVPAMVHFTFTTSPNHLNLLCTARTRTRGLCAVL